jgi:CRISPR-associated protein Csb1
MTATATSARRVLVAELRPLVGQRFQPTGFPDLGAAVFDDGKALLVESAQSMANRLEATTWDDARADQVAELALLPHVKVADATGGFVTSSRLEAHRLACAYIMDGTVDGTTGEKWLEARLGLRAGKGLDHRAVAKACFALDPLSLVHGVFFARKSWPWQPKVARAVTSFIEAYGIRPAVSGGVKRDSVYNDADKASHRTADKGYGSVPHHRIEYTADSIRAFFAIDRAQLRSYGLSEPATALLEAIIDFEIGTLLDGGLRLRTACDLEVVGVEKGERPSAVEAASRIAALARECASELGPVTTVTWQGK